MTQEKSSEAPRPVVNSLGAACSRCRFFKPVDSEPGQCRRRHPLVFTSVTTAIAPGQMKLQLHSYWPVVPGDSWCGEFMAKPIGSA
jgi:hypothetical protein